MALANTSITSYNSSQYCIIYVKVVERVDLTCAHYQKKKITFAFPLTFKDTCKTPCWFALFSLEKYLKFNSYFSIVLSIYCIPKCHSKAVPGTHLAFRILMLDHEVTIS